MKRIIFNNPDTGIMAIITPAYFSRGGERTRQKRPDIILFGEVIGGGWVVVYRNEDGEVIEERNLQVIDSDIILPDGTSIFAETPDEFLDKIFRLRVPPTVIGHIVDDADPDCAAMINEHLGHSTPSFRNALEELDGRINCNMQKARGIQMDKIREVRNAELVKKDIDFMRAIEDGDTDAQSTIKDKKQVLRDIPQTFDLTTDTTEELMGLWPVELERP